MGKEIESKGAKMFKMKIRKGVRTYSRGVFKGADRLGDRLGSERGVVRVKGPFMDGADDAASYG